MLPLSAEPETSHRSRPDVRLDTSLELTLARLADREPSVLATLVGTAGSTYRKAGARMLIMPDGSYHGLLSGGCLEADLQMHAQAVAASGIARAVEYDLRGPDDLVFGIGAGCEGALRVLLEPADAGLRMQEALAAAGGALSAGRPACLVMLHESAVLPLGTYGYPGLAGELPGGLVAAVARALVERSSREYDHAGRSGRTRALVQYLAPAPRLLVCGAGPDARPVVDTALALGWRVTVVDHRAAYAAGPRFPNADVRHAEARALRTAVELPAHHAAVVMSHHLPSDVAYLRELAAAAAPAYVGLLGPAARRRRIAADLGSTMEALRHRLRGPVGLDLGAVTPEAIALAIVGEIHAWLAGRGADPLFVAQDR